MVSRTVARLTAFLILVGLTPIITSVSRAQEPLAAVRVDESLGTILPAGLELVDHEGRSITSDDLFVRGKPTVLTFVYYRCPAACTLLLNGLTAALEESQFVLGRDFNFVTISVDGRETTELAKAKRDTYVQALPGPPHDPNAWSFLTASRDVVTKLTEAVGYRFVYNPDTMQYDHPSVLMFLSPTGQLKRYLYGSYFQPDNVRLAFIEAGDGQLGTFVEQIGLSFYDFGTPELGRKYTLNQNRLAFVLFGMTGLLGFLLWLLVYWSRRRTS